MSRLFLIPGLGANELAFSKLGGYGYSQSRHKLVGELRKTKAYRTMQIG